MGRAKRVAPSQELSIYSVSITLTPRPHKSRSSCRRCAYPGPAIRKVAPPGMCGNSMGAQNSSRNTAMKICCCRHVRSTKTITVCLYLQWHTILQCTVIKSMLMAETTIPPIVRLFMHILD
ncbi:uncharacterized protein HMPREF1120_05057 [Exophiala dermatitidis NIH/UT8656]|uniref:Uncharacterized protein n=1 Tax=Exophiala dermatitidis (strain ATCC 34100 / CBS 525.76 / NIH/UT8656) TaxID=858893 RepID=H6BZD8_EXODN|nr:uncharacterized protein HMPREF1120_05057 [Exophiala dermatitidis NIH/UT8656]EHY57001.1 hypothetical protein HMPREF1120_05057 [Exophiala dermatitidis NIH/UT8656]